MAEDLRTAAQQALETLEADCGGRCNAEYNPCWQRQVAATLRAALAQQAEPVQEPAFHGFMSADGTRVDLCFTPSAPRSDGTYATAYYAAPPQQAEPVEDQRCRAEPRSDGDFVCDCKIGECPGRSAALSQQAEPVQEPETVDQRVVPLVESALQAVAEKIGDQCAVWYGIGARDVEEVLREAVRHGLVHGALAEPVEPVAWIQPDHLQKARVAPFLCRVEPTQRCADFVPLYTARGRYTLSELVKGMQPGDMPADKEWDAAPPVGREEGSAK